MTARRFLVAILVLLASPALAGCFGEEDAPAPDAVPGTAAEPGGDEDAAPAGIADGGGAGAPLAAPAQRVEAFTAADALALALPLARAWDAGAVLVTLTSFDPGNSLQTAPWRALDGGAPAWLLGFEPPGGERTLLVGARADGNVTSNEHDGSGDDGSGRAPREPLALEWVDSSRVADLLRAHPESAGRLSGPVGPAEYALRRSLDGGEPAWDVSVRCARGGASAQVDPLEWNVTRIVATCAPAEEATHPVFRVVGAYGHRDGTSEEDGVVRVSVMIEMPAGSDPLDVSSLHIGHSGEWVGSFRWVPREWEGREPSTFVAAWLRGAGDEATMRPGDLVELRLDYRHREIESGTDVRLLLQPESGSGVTLEFRTPASFGSEKTLTLR